MMATETIDVSILKDHLDKTAHMCTNLLKTLDHQVSECMHRNKMANHKKDTEMESGNISELCQSDDPEIIREENCLLKEAQSKLEDKFQKVIEINHRWQIYNQQRDDYIQFLHSTMQEMRDNYEKPSLRQPSKPEVLESKPEVKTDSAIIQWKSRVDEVLGEQRKMEDEFTKLKLENDLLKQTNAEQEQIVRILREEIDHVKEVKEKFTLMQEQIQIYEQDFQQERNDRERAQAKIEQLEQALIAAKTQLAHVYEPRGVRAQHNRGCEHHGVGVYQCDDEGADAEDDDVADCELSASEDIPACLANGTTLSCPRCKTEYTMENHKHFLEHMETCSE